VRRPCALLLVGAVVVLLTCSAQIGAGPTLDDVVQKLGDYVAAYGEKASLLVAVEKYIQQVATEDGRSFKPRVLVAEFALVRAGGARGSWVGYRDVIEVDGRQVVDRRDRLLRLLTESSAGDDEVARISNESARFNVGPISRNFNVPTAALFFFSPANLSRFAFNPKGKKRIDGIEAWEIDFTETKTPTLIMTRAGKDVRCEGTIWVVPGDGTVLRTRLSIRGFAHRSG